MSSARETEKGLTQERRVPWKGMFTALVTPFHEDGSLDEKGLEMLVRRQVDAGIHGLVPCGTTGESPALSLDEWEQVIQITVETVKGRAWVVAGTGTNNTRASMDRTVRAHKLGADGALVITPYYNKPTPDGLLRHFSMVTEAAEGLPVMVYNVPGRTALNLVPDTVARLVELPGVGAVKEASGNLAQIWEVASRFGETVAVFSGDDGLNLPIFEVGGVGSVSVLTNVVPELAVQLYKHAVSGNRKEALELHWKLAPLCSSLFVETSPAPAKAALTAMGLPAGPVREPLAPMREASLQRLLGDLRDLGVLKS